MMRRSYSAEVTDMVSIEFLARLTITFEGEDALFYKALEEASTNAISASDIPLSTSCKNVGEAL